MRKKVIVQRVIDAVGGKLSIDDINAARELLDYNEWGEALMLIFTQLYEYDVAIIPSVFALIERAGTGMELDSKNWKILAIED